MSYVSQGVEFLHDAVNDAIGPIVSVIGDVAYGICKAIDAIPFVDPDCESVRDFTETFLTDLADDLNPLPNIPTGLLDFGTALINGLTNSFGVEGVYVSTLDGPDKIDLAAVMNLSQVVYGGTGSDTITSGSGEEDIKLYG